MSPLPPFLKVTLLILSVPLFLGLVLWPALRGLATTFGWFQPQHTAMSLMALAIQDAFDDLAGVVGLRLESMRQTMTRTVRDALFRPQQLVGDLVTLVQWGPGVALDYRRDWEPRITRLSEVSLATALETLHGFLAWLTTGRAAQVAEALGRRADLADEAVLASLRERLRDLALPSVRRLVAVGLRSCYDQVVFQFLVVGTVMLFRPEWAGITTSLVMLWNLQGAVRTAWQYRALVSRRQDLAGLGNLLGLGHPYRVVAGALLGQAFTYVVSLVVLVRTLFSMDVAGSAHPLWDGLFRACKVYAEAWRALLGI